MTQLKEKNVEIQYVCERLKYDFDNLSGGEKEKITAKPWDRYIHIYSYSVVGMGKSISLRDSLRRDATARRARERQSPDDYRVNGERNGPDGSIDTINPAGLVTGLHSCPALVVGVSLQVGSGHIYIYSCTRDKSISLAPRLMSYMDIYASDTRGDSVSEIEARHRRLPRI